MRATESLHSLVPIAQSFFHASIGIQVAENLLESLCGSELYCLKVRVGHLTMAYDGRSTFAVAQVSNNRKGQRER